MPGLKGIEGAGDIEEEFVVNALDVSEDTDNFFIRLEDLGLPAKPKIETNDSAESVFNVGGSLNKIKSNQEQIDIIRTSLLQIITVIADNPSVFSKLAKSFGDMHFTAKIGTGAAIVVSPSLAALFASIGAIIGTGVTLGAIYTGLALLLEDHNQCAVNTTEKLETGVNAIVDLFAAVIGELTASIAQLEIVADNLNKEVGLLHGELDRLSEVNRQFEMRERELSAINENLDQSALKYQERNMEQSGLIKEQKILLKEFETTRLDIQTKLTEVQEEIVVRNQMNLDMFLSQNKKLNKTSEELEQDKKTYQHKFDLFLHGAKQDFSEINDKLLQSTGELQESQNVRISLQTELKESTEKLSQLEEKYKKTLWELQKQVVILTDHNKDAEKGVQKAANSLVTTYYAEQKREEPVYAAAVAAKSWFGGQGLFGVNVQRDVPVVNAKLVGESNDSFDL